MTLCWNMSLCLDFVQKVQVEHLPCTLLLGMPFIDLKSSNHSECLQCGYSSFLWRTYNNKAYSWTTWHEKGGINHSIWQSESGSLGRQLGAWALKDNPPSQTKK